MNRLLTSLFGSRSLDPAASGVRFEFALAIPAWAWALIVMACLGAALWCYWHIAGSRLWRTALAALRAGTLLLLAVLVAGPRLVRQPERIERDWVVFMADRSESMAVADVGPGDARISRDAQLRSSLDAAIAPLEKLATDRSALWLGFDGGAFEIAPPHSSSSASPPWAAPTGRRTDLTRPLEQALQRIAARPVSGIVVFSDGRFASPTTRATIQKLQSEQIPVFVVPLGSAGSIADMAVDRIDAPSRAFIDDIVPVNVRLTRSGSDRASPWNARVQLVETATGIVLDEQRLDEFGRTGADGSMDLALAAKPTTVGKVAWTVRIRPDDPQNPDLTLDNNSKALTIDLTDRPIRVVYFDGYPRWEYRYMRGLLLREHSIKSSTLLLSASRKYLQEGSEHLVSVPTSAGDWGSIDVVVIGDVRAELFSPEQLENLKNHIARGGAGLLWIGGPAATPSTWRGTALADLLPFSLARTAQGQDPIRAASEPVLLEPTPAAARLGLMRLGEIGQPPWPTLLSDPDTGWSRMWWSQRIDADRIKPTAETLAVLRTGDQSTDATWPGVLTMRYGSGRIVYIASDETWRWRFGRGEALYERFWLPIVRLLARESLAAAGKAALLEVAPERAIVDQPVRIALRLTDESLSDRLPARLTVRITPAGTSSDADAPARPSTEITLLPEPSAAGEKPSTFTTTWTPPDAGVYELAAIDAALAGVGREDAHPSARVEVITPDDERRTPQTDHAALAALAEQTGGAVIQPDQLASLADKLPNRQVRVLGTPEIDPLWDRPGVLLLFMLLVTAEWLGRKWLRLA